MSEEIGRGVCEPSSRSVSTAYAVAPLSASGYVCGSVGERGAWLPEIFEDDGFDGKRDSVSWADEV